ncbi:MAG: glycosyltransferase family 39 protein [Anaerolineaceae bacterium]|nr:glycosyltransferase family 39 protein [Anaerolineaceae bacterium]
MMQKTDSTPENRFTRIALFVVLCLVWWATRLPGLDSLPLHNDEGLHLTRAVEVWNGHPFWAISDGKIINHWPIALLLPQYAPVIAGRMATILVSLLGLAAGYALLSRLFGLGAAFLGVVLWITSPYLFFFERLALSDAEAGALVVVMLWLCLRFYDSGHWRDAAITGLALGVAVLFKFTAAPFVLMVFVMMLAAQQHSFRRRLQGLILAGMVAAVCFLPPLAYLALRSKDFFSIALGWIGVGGTTGGGQPAWVANITHLWQQLSGFGTLSWAVALIAGLLLLVILYERKSEWNTLILLLAGLLPLGVIILLGREVLPRHYVVALPLLLVLAGAGWGILLKWMAEFRQRWVIGILVSAILVVGFMPFMLTAYRDPSSLPLPQAIRTQYITDHSAGYGLREAVQAFPQTLTQPNIPVIASMFPDSCRRANFYVNDGREMVCAAAPGLVEDQEALDTNGAVYVLVDNAPLIGLDVTTLDAQVEKIAAYPRPGETTETASVVLWLVSAR